MPYLDPAQQRKANLVWLAGRRLRWIRQHGPCAWCGSDERLEIDHVNPWSKAMPTHTIWTRRDAVRLPELAKCQVLCQVCRREKHSVLRMKFAYHGTPTLYFSRRCRCGACVAYGLTIRKNYRATQTRRALERRRARRIVG